MPDSVVSPHDATVLDAAGEAHVVCPVCARAVPPRAAVCPNCLDVLNTTCEACGGPLTVRRTRVRISSAVRLSLEILGVVVIIFTFASIVGPLLGLVILFIAERFGYRVDAHHYCVSCRKRQHLKQP